MKRALVTGARGFIGAHLSEVLEAAGWDVARHSRELPSGSSQLPSGSSRHLDEHSARSDWAQLLADVDVVFHIFNR